MKKKARDFFIGAKVGLMIGAGLILHMILIGVIMYPNVPMFLNTQNRWLGYDTHYEDYIDPDDPLVIEIANYVRLNNLDPGEYVYERIHGCSDFEAWGNIHYMPKPYETVWAGCGDCLNRAVLSASVIKRLDLMDYVEEPATIEYQPLHAYIERVEGNETISNGKIEEEYLGDDTILSMILLYWDLASMQIRILFVGGSMLIWITIFFMAKDTYSEVDNGDGD